MPKARSINQNNMPDTLPNFHNLGVVLRIVLMVNGLMMLIAFEQASSLRNVGQQIIQDSAFVQPVLLACLLLLYLCNDKLGQLTYRVGVMSALCSVAMVAAAMTEFGGDLFASAIEPGAFNLVHRVVLSVVLAAIVLIYFRWRAQSLSPAVSEARLQALQARIRPHFLFNSINAVLGIVRSDPKRAEAALEDMADLFRMAMADNRELVTLKQEIALSRQYLALEQLRLGDRLKINWQMQDLPADAMIPPLMLQPLLENAVYHGIEPMHDGGEITIELYRSGKEVHLDVYNPCQPQRSSHSGNKMALANIRERLALQFDVEAKYSVEAGENFYRVHILIPYVREESL